MEAGANERMDQSVLSQSVSQCVEAKRNNTPYRGAVMYTYSVSVFSHPCVRTSDSKVLPCVVDKKSCTHPTNTNGPTISLVKPRARMNRAHVQTCQTKTLVLSQKQTDRPSTCRDDDERARCDGSRFAGP